MKHRPLWPLLPPVVVLMFTALFLTLTTQFNQKGAHCFIHSSTGLHCPGCGGTRSAHDLISGNLMAALSHHALLVVGVFSFGLLSLYLIVRMTILGRPAPRIPNISTKWIWVGVSILVLFTLLRNIPAWPFSLLAP